MGNESPTVRNELYGLGVPNNRLTCMQGLKTPSLSYNMHLFLTLLAQRLPNDSLNDSFF